LRLLASDGLTLMGFLRALMFVVADIRTRSNKHLFRSTLVYSLFTTARAEQRYREHQLGRVTSVYGFITSFADRCSRSHQHPRPSFPTNRPDGNRIFPSQFDFFHFMADYQAFTFTQRVLHRVQADLDFQHLAVID